MKYMNSDQRWPANNHRVLRDVIIVSLATISTAVLCARFDLSEALFHWTRRFESAQFDELPTVLLVLAIGFAWFAAQRYREAGDMLARQRAADVRLSTALEENRRLAQQYLSAQESERKNLARELHDELGQYLNAIKIDALAIRDDSLRDHGSKDTQDIRDMSNAILRNTDHVYATVTELIRKLRPVGLDELGLVAAIEHCIEQWRGRMPAMRISLSAEGDLASLSEQATLTAYRLAQESLTNAAKHSRAARVAIELRRSVSVGESRIVVNIDDDGVGVDLRERKSGFGLASMRERVEMQGGRFDIRSAPMQGFALSASFPA